VEIEFVERIVEFGTKLPWMRISIPLRQMILIGYSMTMIENMLLMAVQSLHDEENQKRKRQGSTVGHLCIPCNRKMGRRC
jgi:hypothetical protein